MRHIAYIVSISMIAGWASVASAYTPQWLECKGDMTFTPRTGDAGKQAVDDFYVVDSDTKNLFKYFADKKSTSFVGGEAAGNVVTWSGMASGIDADKWQGKLDLGAMSLRVEETGADGKRVWDQHCAPTSPQPQS